MPKQEKRRSVRIPIPIEVSWSANSSPLEARLQDLSEGGMFLETHHPVPIGTKLRFKFELPADPPFEVSGVATVAWSEPRMGVGVEFEDMPNELSQKIRFFVASKLFA